MNVINNINFFNRQIPGHRCRLIAVSKTQPISKLQEAYSGGQRLFGENKVQELVSKHEVLPKDIEWHMIGHLQRNKVKYIAPFIALIHSVDSLSLLQEINKEGKKAGRVIPCLLQIHIAKEDTKYGFNAEEAAQLFKGGELNHLDAISINGLMGIATLTQNEDIVRNEFHQLRQLFESFRRMKLPQHLEMKELSMGMSADYQIAVEEGSTLIRIGSAIFGERIYH